MPLFRSTAVNSTGAVRVLPLTAVFQNFTEISTGPSTGAPVDCVRRPLYDTEKGAAYACERETRLAANAKLNTDNRALSEALVVYRDFCLEWDISRPKIC